jgi:hypothetical protein
MGYGEVGGGGSVQWQICHQNKKPNIPVPPPLKTQRGGAIDPDSADGAPLYVVIKTPQHSAYDSSGRLVVRVSITSKDDVVLLWGTDIPAALQALTAAEVKAAEELEDQLTTISGAAV